MSFRGGGRGGGRGGAGGFRGGRGGGFQQRDMGPPASVLGMAEKSFFFLEFRFSLFSLLLFVQLEVGEDIFDCL